MKARFVAILVMLCFCSTVTAFAQSFQQMQQQQLQTVKREADLAKKCASELSVYAGAFDNGSVEAQLTRFESAFVAALRQRGEGADLTDVIQAHPLPKYESFALSVWVDLSASEMSDTCTDYFYKGTQWLKFDRLARLVIRMNTFTTIKKDYEFRKQFLSPDDPNNPFRQLPNAQASGTTTPERHFGGGEHDVDRGGKPTTSATAGRGPASEEERGRIGNAIMTSPANPVGSAMKAVENYKKEQQAIIDEAEHSIEGATGGGGANGGNSGSGGASSSGHGGDPKKEPHEKDPKDPPRDH